MRTITTTPSRESAARPEWRRICHVYLYKSLRSVCGTARRQADRGHGEVYCKTRGHSICVVCTEMMENPTM